MIEIYEVKSGKAPGWRFRSTNEVGDITFTSNGSYPDRAEALRVAKVINATMWAGRHKIRKARA